VYHGEEVIVSKSSNGQTSFKLPRFNKFYTLSSGRIYERGLNREETTPEADNPPSGSAQQLDYEGLPETVDTTIFNNKIICTCGNVRYVKKADIFQVKKCKPCTLRERKERRREARREKMVS